MSDIGSRISQASTFEDAAGAVVDAISEKVTDIFMMGKPEVDVHKKVSDYGVDSSIVVKICIMLTLRAETEVSIFDTTKSAIYFVILRIGYGKEQSSQYIATYVFYSMLLENAYIYIYIILIILTLISDTLGHLWRRLST